MPVESRFQTAIQILHALEFIPGDVIHRFRGIVLETSPGVRKWMARFFGKQELP